LFLTTPVVSRMVGSPVTRTALRIWRHPANRHRRGRRLVLWMAWQVWERTVRRPWTVTMPPGLALELAPHDPVTSGVLYCGLPDWPEMCFVRDYLRAGDTVVDVGANVGLYSLLAASVEGVQVVAFEPDDDARQRADGNVARNGLGDRIQLRPQAAGAAAGTSAFSVGLGPENHVVANGQGPRTVDVVALDDVVPGPVALLKVDVEGHEAAVLDGAAGLLRRHHPVVVVEANDPGALTERLAPLGYRWVDYDPVSRRAIPSAGPPAARANGIAAADFAALDERLAGR
jgi:FkbM family methyltransferase